MPRSSFLHCRVFVFILSKLFVCVDNQRRSHWTCSSAERCDFSLESVMLYVHFIIKNFRCSILLHKVNILNKRDLFAVHCWGIGCKLPYVINYINSYYWGWQFSVPYVIWQWIIVLNMMTRGSSVTRIFCCLLLAVLNASLGFLNSFWSSV